MAEPLAPESLTSEFLTSESLTSESLTSESLTSEFFIPTVALPELLAHLKRRSTTAWLSGIDAQQLFDLTLTRYQILRQYQRDRFTPTVLLAESDPLHFLSGFLAAAAAQCPVFLTNPHWANAEWQQVQTIVQPNLIWSTHPLPLVPSLQPATVTAAWMMIPTGGSSGRIKFAIHTWNTLAASATGFRDYFQVDRIHSCCILPLYHVSGLMQFIRSFLFNGQLVITSTKTIDAQIQAIDPSRFFISLVPTQLQQHLSKPWLSQFHTILLGGAPAWDDLLATARANYLRLAPTYGMTETASQIATLKPDSFLAGQTGCGQLLPHAKIRTADSSSLPIAPSPHRPIAPSPLALQSTSLALGYYPDRFPPSEWFLTNDLGYFDAQQSLHIVGRSSQVIITGGENVFAPEVEAVMRASGLVKDICVMGVPDRLWGEVVTAVYVPLHDDITLPDLQAALSDRLSRFKHPKLWIAVDSLPYTAQGKIHYERVRQMVGRGAND